jgi:integrase
MTNPIRKGKTLTGTTVWIVDGRRYGASPARPQFATKELAEEALSKMIEQRGGGLNPSRRDVTFATLADEYMKAKETDLAGKTFRTFQSMLKVNLLPELGTKRVVDIDTPLISAFLLGKRPAYKPSSVRRMRAVLSMIMQTAVARRLVKSNPVREAVTGSKSRKSRIEQSRVVAKERSFTAEQQTALLTWCAANDPELHDLLFLLFKTGCRPGEARALTWDKVLDDVILVEVSADDQNVVTPTKTGVRRSVDMSPALKELLHRRWLHAQLNGATQQSFVFGKSAPLAVRVLPRRFETALKKCEITGHHVMYDCRHTFASTLLSRNVPILYVSKQLGHAKPSTTWEHYAHWMPSEGQRYVDTLDDRASIKSAS